MIVYIILLFLPYGLKFILRNKISETNILKISFIGLFIFMAIRFKIGWDYDAYMNIMKSGSYLNYYLKGEFLSAVLLELSSKTGFYQLYFIINSAITCVLFCKIILNYSKDFFLSYYIFVSFPLFMLNSLSIVRFFTALAIVMYGYTYLHSDRIMKFYLCVIVACFFHTTALFALVFPFIVKSKLKINFYVLAPILLFPIRYFVDFIVSIVLPQYSYYLEPYANKEGTKAIIVLVVIYVFALYNHFKKIKIEFQNKYLKIFFISVIFYLSFFNQGPLGHRTSLFGTIFLVIILPDIIANTRVFFRKLVYMLTIIVFLASYLYTLYMGESIYIPYRVFLNELY